MLAKDLNPKFLEAVANMINTKALFSVDVFHRIMRVRENPMWWMPEKRLPWWKR